MAPGGIGLKKKNKTKQLSGDVVHVPCADPTHVHKVQRFPVRPQGRAVTTTILQRFRPPRPLTSPDPGNCSSASCATDPPGLGTPCAWNCAVHGLCDRLPSLSVAFTRFVHAVVRIGVSFLLSAKQGPAARVGRLPFARPLADPQAVPAPPVRATLLRTSTCSVCGDAAFSSLGCVRSRGMAGSLVAPGLTSEPLPDCFPKCSISVISFKKWQKYDSDQWKRGRRVEPRGSTGLPVASVPCTPSAPLRPGPASGTASL